MSAKAVTITVGISTNLQVNGRYFASMRDNRTSNQLTTRTADLDDVLSFIGSVQKQAQPLGIAVAVEDETGELAL